MSELQKRLQMARLPPVPPVGPGRVGRGAKRGMGIGKRDYTPISWSKYFTNMRDIKLDQNSFRVYERGSEGPVCLLLHGGGFSALSWALLTDNLMQSVNCRCTAVDLRGHGDSYTTDDYALSADSLTKDVGDIVEGLYGDDPPPIILIGHSMGGAIAVRVAAQQIVSSITALIVIDVVEGTALEALTSMQSLLRGRPAGFHSLPAAIEWCVRSGQVRNLESARVSMSGQVVRSGSTQACCDDISTEPQASQSGENIIEEEEEETAAPSATTTMPPPPENSTKSGYTWRIDLGRTEPFWRGWFEGLSQLFLSSSVPKMLLLAGVDRLDKDLTVGQMQGKFQMHVLPQAGHAIHEDAPEKVADVIATFMVRHRMTTPKDGFHQTFPAC